MYLLPVDLRDRLPEDDLVHFLLVADVEAIPPGVGAPAASGGSGGLDCDDACEDDAARGPALPENQPTRAVPL